MKIFAVLIGVVICSLWYGRTDADVCSIDVKYIYLHVYCTFMACTCNVTLVVVSSPDQHDVNDYRCKQDEFVDYTVYVTAIIVTSCWSGDGLRQAIKYVCHLIGARMHIEEVDKYK